jgi:hypothetical protein
MPLELNNNNKKKLLRSKTKKKLDGKVNGIITLFI